MLNVRIFCGTMFNGHFAHLVQLWRLAEWKEGSFPGACMNESLIDTQMLNTTLKIEEETQQNQGMGPYSIWLDPCMNESLIDHPNVKASNTGHWQFHKSKSQYKLTFYPA